MMAVWARTRRRSETTQPSVAATTMPMARNSDCKRSPVNQGARARISKSPGPRMRMRNPLTRRPGPATTVW